MRTIRHIAHVAAVVGLVATSGVQASGIDGEWRGRGEPVTGECNGFSIVAQVDDRTISGTVLRQDRELSISGHVAENGQVRGQVSYLLWTVGELSGHLASGRASGTWRTFRGPKCTGRFVIHRIRAEASAAGVEAQFN